MGEIDAAPPFDVNAFTYGPCARCSDFAALTECEDHEGNPLGGLCPECAGGFMPGEVAQLAAEADRRKAAR